MNTLSHREILACIAIQEKGDWSRIYERIKEKDYPSDDEAIETLKTIKYNYITLADEVYPDMWKNTYRPPFVLFYYGDINILLDDPQKCLAVIGSREYTEYGEKITRQLVKEVAKERVIVSGLAKGIDTIAAETAIKYGGKTVAVLGSGIDYCYPFENFDLYLYIKKYHLLISEYPGNVVRPVRLV